MKQKWGWRATMYDFHDSTDTLKFWTEKVAINKTFFVFHPILIKLGEVVVHNGYYNFTKLHQNQMKNKKSLINNTFFCSEFQSVSRIVKIVHSVSALSTFEKSSNTDDKYNILVPKIRISGIRPTTTTRSGQSYLLIRGYASHKLTHRMPIKII